MSSGAMWLAVCLAGGAQGQELPRATMEYGAFAFPDPSGMRLQQRHLRPMDTAVAVGARARRAG